MAMQMQIQFASIQQGEKLMKIIGLIPAPEIAKLMDDVSLKPNPRSPNVNKITRAIDATLDKDPELLQYKTKGVLAAGKYVRRDNAVFFIDFTTPSYGGILDGGHNFFAIVRHMMIEAVKYKYSSMKKEDKKIRSEVERTRSWKDLIERWQCHEEIVKEFANSVSGLGMSSRFSINQRFRIWRRDVLRRIHRVGNLSPAEAAESAEGGFGQREPPRPMDRVLNPSVLSEVAGQPPRVIQSGIQARIPC